jgi:purine-binding chemotaxis protein CheW
MPIFISIQGWKSMTNSIYVQFKWNGQRYAVEMDFVDEIVSLPELTVVPDAPRYLAGVVDVRGAILPVLDLSVWLGDSSSRRSLSDNLILLRGAGRRFGMIVNEVIDVTTLTGPPMVIRDVASRVSQIVIAAVRIESDIAFLLDRQMLMRFAETAQASIDSSVSDTNERALFRNVSPEDQPVFHARALRLMREQQTDDQTGFVSLAVIRISGEFFGVPLEYVREFAEARDITPVPCCPRHIVGEMNLRGEVLTVIDLRPFLNVPASTASPGGIIVTNHGGILAGVVVEEINAVIHLDPKRITDRLSSATHGTNRYWIGTARHEDRVLTILDMRQIMESEDLVVNLEV